MKNTIGTGQQNNGPPGSLIGVINGCSGVLEGCDGVSLPKPYLDGSLHTEKIVRR